MATGATKRIVCLANSRKPGGRCVAGKELLPGINPGKWIRPVTDEGTGAVRDWERQYEDGSDPAVLDVIDMPFVAPQPKDYQQENWVLGTRPFWKKTGRLPASFLPSFTDSGADLWGVGDSSSTGQNNRVELSVANSLTTSLSLIEVDNLGVHVSQTADGTARFDGQFSYCGVNYKLRITDPVFEQRHRRDAKGFHKIGQAFLTISLGEPFESRPLEIHAYKLIAAVITP